MHRGFRRPPSRCRSPRHRALGTATSPDRPEAVRRPRPPTPTMNAPWVSTVARRCARRPLLGWPTNEPEPPDGRRARPAVHRRRSRTTTSRNAELPDWRWSNRRVDRPRPRHRDRDSPNLIPPTTLRRELDATVRAPLRRPTHRPGTGRLAHPTDPSRSPSPGRSPPCRRRCGRGRAARQETRRTE
ncbi:MAG: hypothetical protein RIS41_547 [Actinomycetota bacterium]